MPHPIPHRDPTMLFALFKSETTLPPLIEQLRRLGLSDDRMDILSSRPIQPALLRSSNRLPLHRMTILAGVIGLASGLVLAGGTAMLYPIQTGAQPIVAFPVLGIIAFEIMMLGAIVCTFLIMVKRIVGIHQSSKFTHDARIDDGMIGVSIQILPSQTSVSQVHHLLSQAGAHEIQILMPSNNFSVVREVGA